MTPVIIAFGNFDASKISQHPSVEMHFIPWWGNALCVILFGTTCLLQWIYLPPFGIFWLVALVSGCSNILAWHFKIQAFKNDRVSRVSPISYLESVFGLLIDRLIFDVDFGTTQLIGISLVFGMFIAKIYYSLFWLKED